MGKIIIKVPVDVEETIELTDISLIKKILDLKKENPRKDWSNLLKNGNKEEQLINDFFKDENLEWWEW